MLVLVVLVALVVLLMCSSSSMALLVLVAVVLLVALVLQLLHWYGLPYRSAVSAAPPDAPHPPRLPLPSMQVSPPFDTSSGLTAMTAANLLFEILCVVSQSPSLAGDGATGGRS